MKTLIISLIVVAVPVAIYYARKKKIGTRFFGEESRDENDSITPKDRF